MLVKVSIAVNEKWTNKETGEKKESVSFIEVDFWNKYGEQVAKHFKKGDKTQIGRLMREGGE